MCDSHGDIRLSDHETTRSPHLIQKPAESRRFGSDPNEVVILKSVNVIDGTGAPLYGPADILIKDGRIERIINKGDALVGLMFPERDLLEDYPTARVMDLEGHYVLPGFVDSHGHIGSAVQAPSADYVYKLWLAHGVTTVRDVACAWNGMDFTISEAQRSEANEICAPRILANPYFGQGMEVPITTARDAAAWVNAIAERGAKGVKFFSAKPEAFQAALAELNKLGMDSACHHEPRNVSRINAMTSARWGLRSIEHWYGLPEAMFDGKRTQNFDAGYNYGNEPSRYAAGGPLWLESAEPGSKKWVETLEEWLALGTTMSPTFNIYIGHRDAARVRNSEWHDEFTAPTLWKFFQPNPENHGSVYGDWGTEQEVPWRQAYQRWMALVNDYKNMGGRVTVGSDSGFIYKTYGFGQVEELELMREAGFHPLEVIRAATLSTAELVGLDDEIGSIEMGKRADLFITKENPLTNFKLLYGHGVFRPNSTERAGGVKYTVRNGIIYDAEELRDEVRAIVAEDRERQQQKATQK